MDQARVVVTLVQILQDTGEDFGLLCRQVNASRGGFEELTRKTWEKYGEWERTSSCAANRRWSEPTTMVTMAEVRLGETGSIIGLSMRTDSILSSICLCLWWDSRKDLFDCLVILPERSFELEKERFPNMVGEEAEQFNERQSERRKD